MMKQVLWIAVFLNLIEPQMPQYVELEKPPVTGSLSLTLAGAIELALERNPTLLVEKIRLEQAREKTYQEMGSFNWLVNLRGVAARRENIVASRFYPTGTYVDSERAPSAGIEGRTSTGGRLGVAIDYRRLVSTSNTQTLSPQYSANLAFNFSQAFWRDFGAVNKTRIRVAQKGEEVAERTLVQRMFQLVRQVEETYWNLIFLREDLDVKLRSLNVARALLKQNQELQRAGIVAQVSVLEALAGVATREENVITAESEVERVEDELKILLWLEPSAADVTAVEASQQEAITIDAARSFQTALQRRPEVEGLQREVEQREIELKFAANQTKPRLDLNAQYGVAGLSGRPNPTCVDPTSPFCEPVGRNVGDSIFARQTRPEDAISQLLSRHPFDTWSIELKLQIPLGNRTANAQYAEAYLRLLETSTRLRALRTQIEQEVRDAVRETQTARKRIDASRETIKFVEDQLDGERRKFEAGLSSSYDVLQILGELDKARTTERRAVMDFNIGQSKIRFAEATTLERYNIEMKKPPRYFFQQGNAAR
jgi:outer membrane protein TolC